MTFENHFRRQFAFDAWANGETVASLVRAGKPPEKAIALLAHLAAAQRLWLDRLHGRPPSIEVLPDLTLEQCDTMLAELRSAWASYLDDLSPARLAQFAHYVNSRGERWSSRVLDILAHVIMHGVYHRGQIASELRRAGHEPARTDWIHASRQGLI